MIGESAASGGDVIRPGTGNEGNGQIAQGGEHVGSGAGAERRAIFAKGDIADVMQAVLDVPVAPHQGQQALRAGLCRREGGDEIHGLLAGLARSSGRDVSAEAPHLGDLRPARLGGQVGREVATQGQAPEFTTATVAVEGLGLRRGRARIGEEQREISGKGGLIVLDRQHHVGAQRMEGRHKRRLRMQRIGVTGQTDLCSRRSMEA